MSERNTRETLAIVGAVAAVAVLSGLATKAYLNPETAPDAEQGVVCSDRITSIRVVEPGETAQDIVLQEGVGGSAHYIDATEKILGLNNVTGPALVVGTELEMPEFCDYVFTPQD